MLHRWSQWAASGVTVFEGANKLALIRNVQSACCSLQHVCYMTMHVNMQKNTCQHAAPSPDGVFGCPDSWVYCTPGSSDSSAHLDLRLYVWMFAAGRMVLRFFLGSHGTLVAVSAMFMMPLRDSGHSNECSLYVL